jgi:hypothetical protein
MVCTLSTDNLTALYPIRSYRVRGAPAPPFTILQTARACIAAPDRFLPVTIGTDHRKITLIDATTGFANPAKELLQEAQRVFGEDTNVATIVSIGSGEVETSKVPDGDDDDALVEALQRVRLTTEPTHAELEARLHDTFIYFRFKVDRDFEGGMDASLLHSYTSTYLQKVEVSRRLDEAMKSIHARPKGVVLKELSEWCISSFYLLSDCLRLGDRSGGQVEATTVGSTYVCRARRYSRINAENSLR